MIGIDLVSIIVTAGVYGYNKRQEHNRTKEERKFTRWTDKISMRMNNCNQIMQRIEAINAELVELEGLAQSLDQCEISSRTYKLIKERNQETDQLTIAISATRALTNKSQRKEQMQCDSRDEIKRLDWNLEAIENNLNSQKNGRILDEAASQKNATFVDAWKNALDNSEIIQTASGEIRSPKMSQADRSVVLERLKAQRDLFNNQINDLQSLVDSSQTSFISAISNLKSQSEDSYRVASFYVQSDEENQAEILSWFTQKNNDEYAKMSILYASKLFVDGRLSELNSYLQDWMSSLWSDAAPITALRMGEFIAMTGDSQNIDRRELANRLSQWIAQHPDNLRYQRSSSGPQIEVLDELGNPLPNETFQPKLSSLSAAAELELLRGFLLYDPCRDISLNDFTCFQNCDEIASSDKWKHGKALFHHSIFEWNQAAEQAANLTPELNAFFNEQRIRDQHDIYCSGLEMLSLGLRFFSSGSQKRTACWNVANFALFTAIHPVVKNRLLPMILQGCTQDFLQQAKWAGETNADLFYFTSSLIDFAAIPLLEKVTSEDTQSKAAQYLAPVKSATESVIGSAILVDSLKTDLPELLKNGQWAHISQMSVSYSFYLSSHILSAAISYRQFRGQKLSITEKALAEAAREMRNITFPVRCALKIIPLLGRGAKWVAARFFRASLTLPAGPVVATAITVAQIGLDLFAILQQVFHFSDNQTKQLLLEAQEEYSRGYHEKATKLLNDAQDWRFVDREMLTNYTFALYSLKQMTDMGNHPLSIKKFNTIDTKLDRVAAAVHKESYYAPLYQSLQCERGSFALRMGDFKKASTILKAQSTESSTKERIELTFFQQLIESIYAQAYKEAKELLRKETNDLKLDPKYSSLLSECKTYLTIRETTDPKALSAIGLDPILKETQEFSHLSPFTTTLQLEKARIYFESNKKNEANMLLKKEKLLPIFVLQSIRQVDCLADLRKYPVALAYLFKVKTDLDDLGSAKPLIEAYEKYISAKQKCPTLVFANNNDATEILNAIDSVMDLSKKNSNYQSLQILLKWTRMVIYLGLNDDAKALKELDDSPDELHNKLALFISRKAQELLNTSKYDEALAYLDPKQNLSFQHQKFIQEYKTYAELKKKHPDFSSLGKSEAVKILNQIQQTAELLPFTENGIDLEITLYMDALSYAIAAERMKDISAILVKHDDEDTSIIATLFAIKRADWLTSKSKCTDAQKLLLDLAALKNTNDPTASKALLEKFESLLKDYVAYLPERDKPTSNSAYISAVNKVLSYNNPRFREHFLELNKEKLFYCISRDLFEPIQQTLGMQTDNRLDLPITAYLIKRCADLPSGLNTDTAYSQLSLFTARTKILNPHIAKLQSVLKFLKDYQILDSSHLEQQANQMLKQLTDLNNLLSQAGYPRMLNLFEGMLYIRLADFSLLKDDDREGLNRLQKARQLFVIDSHVYTQLTRRIIIISSSIAA